MARPHQTHVVPSYPRRGSGCDGPQSTDRQAFSLPHSLPSRLNSQSISPPQKTEVFEYALGTLEYRKQRNRKRTKTGEYVWTDEADLVFALGLIDWASSRLNRIGKRRANFLQQYLARNGFTKTRKQIASRLQVLKGEWRATSYMTLLEDHDCPENRSCRISCESSSSCDQKTRDSRSPPRPSTSSPASTRSFLPEGEVYSAMCVPDERDLQESVVFPSLAVQEHRNPLGTFVEHVSYDPRGEVYDPSKLEMPYQVMDHRLQMHAPRAVVPNTILFQSHWPFEVRSQASFPGSSAHTSILTPNSHTTCELPASDTSLQGLLRKPDTY